jgi:hypothetical protein
MRATRDRLRRRLPLMRQRMARRAHGHNTNRLSHLPEMGQKSTSTANRDGVTARFPAPAVHKRLAVDLALRGHDDDLGRDVALAILTAATQDDAHTLDWRRTVPGIGEILSLVRRDERRGIQRCPRGQAFVSDGRLVKCARASAGQRDGTARTQIGHAYRTWACAEAAVLCRRHHPLGQQSLSRVAKTPGTGRSREKPPSRALWCCWHGVANAQETFGRLPCALPVAWTSAPAPLQTAKVVSS